MASKIEQDSIKILNKAKEVLDKTPWWNVAKRMRVKSYMRYHRKRIKIVQQMNGDYKW